MPDAPAPYEGLGVFYLGREVDSAGVSARPSSTTRRPDDPRAHRRHDRRGKTGLGDRAARGGRDRRRPVDRHRPEGRPRQPRCSPSPSWRPRTSALDRPRRGARRRASRRRRSRREQAEPVEKRARRLGRRTASASAASRDAADVMIYTPGSNAGRAAVGARARGAAAGEAADAGGAPRARHGRRRRPARRCSASTPTRCAAASTSCSSTLLARRLAGAGRTLDLADADRSRSRRRRSRARRARPRRLLPGARTASRLAMALNNLLASPGFAAWREGEPLDIGKPALRPRRQAARSRSARSPTSATPSGCSSSRCCSPRSSPGCARSSGTSAPAGAALHGRDLRLPPAEREAAEQGACC